MKIGIFDSGVGGLSVLEEIGKELLALRVERPNVLDLEIIYLGDTANLPYGSKSPGKVSALSCDCVRLLKEKGVDAIVVACNTASSHALAAIREAAGEIPVLGVVEPGAEVAVKAHQDRKLSEVSLSSSPIVVMATRGTVQSGAYLRALQDRGYTGEVIQIPCPLLVPFIEEGWTTHPILVSVIEEYVRDVRVRFPQGGTVVLGCTHYPWILQVIQSSLPVWTVVHSGPQLAKELISKLGITQVSRLSFQWMFTDPGGLPMIAREAQRRVTAQTQFN